MNPHLPHGHHGVESSLSVMPFLGTFLLLLLLVLVALYLWHQGKLPLPKLGSHRSPEDEAKQILAERFARGDITSDGRVPRAVQHPELDSRHRSAAVQASQEPPLLILGR